MVKNKVGVGGGDRLFYESTNNQWIMTEKETTRASIGKIPHDLYSCLSDMNKAVGGR
jgi:hypothetical protein